MSLVNKIMWMEGMFLRPHHFQQQDHRTESLITSRVASIAPFFWGFSKLKIESDFGKVRIKECEGAFLDGLAFSLSQGLSGVSALDIPDGAANKMVWLCAPSFSESSMLGEEVSDAGTDASTRYVIETTMKHNLLARGDTAEPIKIGTPNLFLKLGEPPERGVEYLPIAHVSEVKNGREVVFDPTFIPTITTVDASIYLSEELKKIVGLFVTRAESLAGRSGVAGGSSVAAQELLMLLRVCNFWTGRLAQMLGAKKIHPLELHKELCSAASELATFINLEARLPEQFPPYDHDNLTSTFAPVIDNIKQSLGQFVEQRAELLTLELNKKYQIHYAASIDDVMLNNSRFVLAAKASMADEEFRTTFPRRVSIGSTHDIMDIIRAAERSIPLRPLSHFPNEIPRKSGWVCFELDKNSPGWEKVMADKAIAIHPQSVFEELSMDLWVIKD